jgi:SAM-dependent methyltransferase
MSTHAKFYAAVDTGEVLNQRLEAFLDQYRSYRADHQAPLSIADVGCGAHAVLHRHVHPDDEYVGIDVKPKLAVDVDRYVQADLNEDDLAEAVDGHRFDVIFCGEVLEHVFSPDRLLRQLHAVMHEESLLILSTPNLAYWINRLLLLVGISPLFVENSAEVKLGRRLRAFGQGNETQGHIRLFTNRAAVELIRRERFELLRTLSVPVWNLPLDGLICRLSPNLAPVNVYILRRSPGVL